MKRLYLAAILLFGSSLLAQEPMPPAPPEPTPVLEIKGAKQGQRDDFLDFEAVGEPDKCTYRWLVLPRGIVKQRQEGDKLTIVGKPGKYTLLLSVSTGEVESAAEIDFEIVEGVKPNPGPDPPGPNPPTPTVTKLRVIYIEETKDATQTRAKWLSDAALLKYFDDENKSYVAVDKDVRNQAGQIPREIAPALERVKAKGIALPAFVIENHDTNEIIADGTLKGSTPAQHLAYLKGVAP